MTLPAPTYDLVLLLDPEAEEATRAKLLADARAAIEAQGEFLRHDAWGNRALAYPIDRKAVGEYHLLQFHADTPALLAALNRSLRIADDILRFRIVKLKPGVPDAPDMQGTPAPTRRPEPEPEPPAERQPEAGVEDTAQAEPRVPATPTGPGVEAMPTGAGVEATPTEAGGEATPRGTGVEAMPTEAGGEATPNAETDAQAEPGIEVQAEVEAEAETAHGEPS
jgi:small subunit ribosomal protein S6